MKFRILGHLEIVSSDGAPVLSRSDGSGRYCRCSCCVRAVPAPGGR